MLERFGQSPELGKRRLRPAGWAAYNACRAANPSRRIVFPKTQAAGACDYYFSGALRISGSDARLEGEVGGGNNGVTFCFAANVGGRMMGTCAALLTTQLANVMPGASAPTKLAYASALVGTAAYMLGLLTSFWLPEPKREELPD